MESFLGILAAGIVVLAAYWLPGAAASTLLEWKDFSRAARLLSPFPISIVLVPVVLNLSAFIWPNPHLIPVIAGFAGVCLFTGWILSRLGKRPQLTCRSRRLAPIPRWEILLAGAFMLMAAAVAMLPRLHMIWHGSEINTAIFSDVYWHLSELTSIAAGGMPPKHYLFPDLPLVYYYGSWVYPAMLSALPALGGSLIRLLNVHAAINLLIYLFVLYGFLRVNIGSAKMRWFAMFLLTFAGGMDFFSGPNMYPHEWWQAYAPMLVSQVQIPSSLVTNMWVPQHIAGAMAFIWMLGVWRNLRGDLFLRGILCSLLAAFIFSTSVFVFVSMCVAVLVWAFLYRRLIRSVLFWRTIIPAAVLFLLVSGPQLLLSVGGTGVVRWGGFRVILFEAVTGTWYEKAMIADQVVTIAALPLIAGAILCVEMGLTFILYALWTTRHVGAENPAWFRFLAIYPLVFLPVAFLLLPPNFSMRGSVPVLAVMSIAAALYLGSAGVWRAGRWRRSVTLYLIGWLMVAQTVSPMVEWWFFARRALAESLRPVDPVFPLPGKGAYPDDYQALIPAYGGPPENLAYILWANENLPPDALVVEVGLPDDNRMHLLERMRVVDPAEVSGQSNGQRDFTLAGDADVAGWWEALNGETAWEKAMQTEYYLGRRPPVYLVAHAGSGAVAGQPVYQDDFVIIYLIRGRE